MSKKKDPQDATGKASQDDPKAPDGKAEDQLGEVGGEAEGGGAGARRDADDATPYPEGHDREGAAPEDEATEDASRVPPPEDASGEIPPVPETPGAIGEPGADESDAAAGRSDDDADLPHGEGSVWPDEQPGEMAAGLDHGSEVDDPAAARRGAADPAAERASAPLAEPAEDPYHDDEVEDHGRTSLAARVLQILVVLLIGAGLALWALPRVAPHLPAPIAAYLEAPGQVHEGRLAQLREQIEANVRARMSEVEAKIQGAAGGAEGLGDRLKAVEAKLADASQTDDSALKARVEALEKGQADLKAQLASLSKSLGSVANAEDLPKEAAQRLAALAGTTETLRGQVSDISSQVDKLQSAFDAASKKFEDRAAAAETAAEAAAKKTAAAERKATLTAEFRALDRALEAGQPYADPLQTLSKEGDAPKALSDHAQSGVAPLADLRADFTDAARKAIEAQRMAEAGDGFLDRALASVKGRLEGVPTQPGDRTGMDADLGQANVDLRSGDLAGALAALDKLPEAAKTAMAHWLDRAKARLAAIQAAADWRASLMGDGS